MNRHERRAAKANGASVDKGFPGYQAAVGKRIPGVSDREVAEAYMRAEVHDLKPVGGDNPDLAVRPGIVRVEAQYGEATLAGTIEAAGAQFMADQWASTLKPMALKRPGLDLRAVTRSAVVEGLVLNRQVTESGAALLMASLLWLTLDGPGAAQVRPLLAAGGVTIRYEITDTGPGAWNFRLRAF